MEDLKEASKNCVPEIWYVSLRKSPLRHERVLLFVLVLFILIQGMRHKISAVIKLMQLQCFPQCCARVWPHGSTQTRLLHPKVCHQLPV